MYTICESSPRRSPRHNPTLSEDILKLKSNSPIRKSSNNGVGHVPKSAGALAAVTRQKPRKAKINDENKENRGAVTRPARTVGLQVNANARKASQPLKSKIEAVGRLPLKELPLNGFVERPRRGAVVPTVEIMSTVVQQETTTTKERRQNTQRQNLDEGVGIGVDWEMNGVIR